MSVVRVRQLFPERGGKRVWWTRITYERVWEVVTDNDHDTEGVVYNAVDPVDPSIQVPKFGDRLGDDPVAFVTTMDIKQSADSPYVWYVTATFDTQVDKPSIQPSQGGAPGEVGNTPGNFNQNPLFRPAVWHLGFMEEKEIVDQWLRMDGTGKPNATIPNGWVTGTAYPQGKYVAANGNVYVCVVAGTSGGGGGPSGTTPAVDGTVQWAYWSTLAQATNNPANYILSAFMHSGQLPFDPPYMVPVSIPTISVTKNIPGIDLLYHMTLKNAINLTTWRDVIPPRCAKIVNFTSSNKTENSFTFVEAQWEIALNPDTWDLFILDAGYGTFNTRTVVNPTPPPLTTTKKIFTAFKDSAGNPFTAPVPMDGKGGQLAPDDPPVFLRGLPRQYKVIEFNGLFPW